MRTFWISLLPLAAAILLVSFWGFWEWTDRTGELRAAIAEADEIRITGIGLSGHPDGSQDIVLCRITDPDAIREVRERLAFEKRPEPRCKCFGHPEITWFKGGQRIVSASVHHGKRLRWDGWEGGDWERGDSAFTPASRVWLQGWLEERGVPSLDAFQSDLNWLVRRANGNQRVLLSHCHETDYGPLSGLRNVQQLVLANSTISDLSPLENLADLEMLDLRGTRVTDLRPLVKLPRLRKLLITYAPAMDLEPLGRMESLVHLVVYGVEEDHPILVRLRSMLPACRVWESRQVWEF